MLVARITAVPHHLVNMPDMDDNTVNLVNYMENILMDVQMTEPRNVERKEEWNIQADCRAPISILDEFVV